MEVCWTISSLKYRKDTGVLNGVGLCNITQLKRGFECCPQLILTHISSRGINPSCQVSLFLLWIFKCICSNIASTCTCTYNYYLSFWSSICVTFPTKSGMYTSGAGRIATPLLAGKQNGASSPSRLSPSNSSDTFRNCFSLAICIPHDFSHLCINV